MYVSKRIIFSRLSKTCVSFSHSKIGILYPNLILGVEVCKSVFLLGLCFLGNFLAKEDPSSKTPQQMSTNKIQVIGKRDVLGLLYLKRNINRINMETLSNNSDM
jgi:hypothetical protein